MKTNHIVATVLRVFWWAPTIVLAIAGLIGGEVRAHVRIARASRMFARAERLAAADRLDEAQALLDRGERLLERAKMKPGCPM